MALGGYAGKVLRVDLSEEKVVEEELDEAVLRKYLGGVGLGASILYKEVPPTLEWSHPDNRLIIAGGPVSGSKLDGTGGICVVTKGPLTGGPASSQANGFFAAYLRFCGYDAVIFQGAARRWVYLWIEEGKAELRDASHLLGKDTWETEDLIKAEMGKKERQASVYSIGPAGENLVRFAAILGDKGHAAGHNGTGAVMGSKKLKAVAVARGRRPVKIADPKGFDALAKESFETRFNDTASGRRYLDWGTSTLCVINYPGGRVPVRNLTTAFFPEVEKFSGPYYRPRWKIKANPCWACRCHHCYKVQVGEGPYTGFEGEEGEYEMMAAFGPLIGETDAGAATMLSNICDRLGLEGCEAGWTLGMVMELFEKGVLTGKDTDGLEMTWGNTEAVKALMGKIARREGFGDILAEGVLRASQRIGKEARNCGIFYGNGNTPRTYDLRAGRWEAILDDITASTGVKEGDPLHPEEFGLNPGDPFSPKDITNVTAKMKGKGPFRD
ncbi:MAG: aldehyde ferredoxin oxidoreductase N-terminal domain-containing protein, partial [Chloroflexota bacterium]|nr:aldehyde ferredoxin oxidoreductase N-terminal domain-containing protein [Chloroflexota bacterium]